MISDNQETNVETASSEVSSESNQPSWMLDDNTPGVGDRPEWLPDKFKSVSDMSKSYRELEKRMVSPPDEYDFSNAKYMDTDFEAFSDLKKVAKENRVSQDVMNAFVNSMDSYLKDSEIDPTEEANKLGEGAQERVKIMDNWIENSIDKENAEILLQEIRTADGFKALEKLRNAVMDNQSNVPNGNVGPTESTDTIEEVRSELSNNLEKYKTDPKYRKEIEQKLSRFAGNSEYVDKMGG